MTRLDRLCARITKLHGKILLRGKLDVKDAVRIGRLLNAAKPLCGRTFKAWIYQHCGFSYMQACRYRRLAVFAKGNNLLPFENLYQAYQAAGILPKPAPNSEHERQLLSTAEEIRREKAIARNQKILAERAAFAKQVSILNGSTWKVFRGDMEKKALEIESASIPTIITDPDYLKDNYEQSYQKLARIANRVLFDGGNLITFAAHAHLPHITNILADSGLTYIWLLAYTMGGAQARQWDKKIINEFIPVLWFTKGKKRKPINYITDVIHSPSKEKSFHAWSKNIAACEQLVTQFSAPGEIILDPCCGGGTIGVAARKLGRRFIGIDRDPQAVRITARRIKETVGVA